MPGEITPARTIVESEVGANGPITFARFMEIALYGEHGYYTTTSNPSLDYATSPQMHPAFGALIAGWLFRAWQGLGEPSTFDVVELGAGDGGLAKDIVDAVSGGECDGFRRSLNYHPYDLRPRGSVRAIDELTEITPIVGCVVSNELLDAFPTHIFTIRDGEVLECYVDVAANGDFQFVEDVVSSVEISRRVGKFASILPEGYRGEVNLGISDWAANIANILKRGYVLTIDYGHEREILYHPARTEGSLRCYRDHVLGQNPFRDVGLQDITSHVDFTAIDEALNGVGFESMSELKSQRDFLFDLGFGEYSRHARTELSRSRTQPEVEVLSSELRSLNALVDPRGLGDFRVAQHARNCASINLEGLEDAPPFRLPKAEARHLGFVPYD